MEQSIIRDGKTYSQQGKTVSTAQWDKWIEDEGCETDIADQLRTTFARWMKARQTLAKALPEEQGKSYDNMTADIHSRMIGQLSLLIPLPEL